MSVFVCTECNAENLMPSSMDATCANCGHLLIFPEKHIVEDSVLGPYSLDKKSRDTPFYCEFNGRDEETETQVRLVFRKVASWYEGTQAGDEFLADALAAKQLSHPNIVHIIDAGFTQSWPFVVTDYITGMAAPA